MRSLLVALAFVLTACGGNTQPAPSSSSTGSTDAVAEASAPSAATSTATAAACQAPADCKGMLPKLCKQCPAGQTGGCAHWTCPNNACAVAYCE